LKLVLNNLLGNAIKFTDHGSVTVEVDARDHGVEFCISDTGIGIAPEVLPVIFDSFRQREHAETRRHEGMGLGLSMTQRLLELLGGTITVESEVGRGSMFRVWISNAK